MEKDEKIVPLRQEDILYENAGMCALLGVADAILDYPEGVMADDPELRMIRSSIREFVDSMPAEDRKELYEMTADMRIVREAFQKAIDEIGRQWAEAERGEEND